MSQADSGHSLIPSPVFTHLLRPGLGIPIIPGHDATTHGPLVHALGRASGLALGHLSVAGEVAEVDEGKADDEAAGVPPKRMTRALARGDEAGEVTPSRFRITLAPVPAA
jgi:hypothetical protein